VLRGARVGVPSAPRDLTERVMKTNITARGDGSPQIYAAMNEELGSGVRSSEGLD
jgi:hypothetical protein